MPAIGPMLVLGSLGVVGLLFAAKGAKAAPGAGPAAPNVPPVNPIPGTKPGELQNIPLPLLQEIAKALELLTVGPDGKIIGPVTEDAIRNATALAGKLDAAGFPEAARMLRDFITEAAKKVPSPSKDKQIPLPPQCFTPAEQEQISRLATLERDPKVIRGVVAALRKRATPPECKVQVELAITTLEAVAVQMEARIAEEEALRRIEEELRKKSEGGTSPGQPQPPSPATPPPAPGTTRVVIVNKGEGLANITKRLLGSDSRWRELRDRNVPVDADGRGRAKDTDAKGGIKPMLQPGHKLFVPEQWPAMPGIPVPTPVTPPPPSPVSPPPAGTTRVAIVNKGEGLANITKRLLGSDSRWRELRDRNVPVDADGRTRAKDTDAKGGIKPMLQPGHKLFVPEQWPQMPGVPIPAPVTPTPAPSPAPVTPAVTGQRITIVQSGDGFFRIAQRLGVDGNRWRELRDRNVPVDADGRTRAKDTDAKGGIKPMLQPGHKLFVPESWPQSSFALISGVPLVGIGLSTETINTTEKAPVELAAEEMVTHLNRLQARHPMQFAKVRHKMDKRKIARFQKEANLPITATVSPATLIKAAEFGQSILPLVIDWPEDASTEHVQAYRRVIAEIAKRALAMGDKAAAHELAESVKRECGQAANLSID